MIITLTDMRFRQIRFNCNLATHHGGISVLLEITNLNVNHSQQLYQSPQEMHKIYMDGPFVFAKMWLFFHQVNKYTLMSTEGPITKWTIQRN